MFINSIQNLKLINNRSNNSPTRRLSFGQDRYENTTKNTDNTIANRTKQQIQRTYNLLPSLTKLRDGLHYYNLVDPNLCTNLPQALRSLGISQEKLSDAAQQQYLDVISEMYSPSSDFRSENVPSEIILKYPRENFVNNIVSILEKTYQKNREKIEKHYDFAIIENDYGYHFEGYPIIPTDKAQIPQNLTEAIEQEINDFTKNNQLIIKDHPELSKQLDIITKTFPEWYYIIGKKQHKTHQHTVDIHTLKVLHHAINTPQFDELSELDKQILFTAILLHDVGKRENVGDENRPDHGHALKSAFDAYFILEKTNLPKDVKQRIFELVYNHDWLQTYSISRSKFITAKQIAKNFYSPKNFDLACILAEADLKGVKDDMTFYGLFKNDLENARIQVRDILLN